MSKPSRPPRPSHFLSFPIQDASVQARASEAISILLKAEPRADGIDESLAVDPRSLHLTLGIMPLVGRKAAEKGRRLHNDDHPANDQQDVPKGSHSVEDAGKLLRECAEALQVMLRDRKISQVLVRFDRPESFQADPSKCRVLYAEPAKNTEGTDTLHELAAYLRERFHNAGMLADYNQALTLHCTLMKASARAKKPSGQNHTAKQMQEASLTTKLPEAGDQSGREDAIVEADNTTTETSEGPDAVKQNKKKRSRPKARFAKKTPFDASLVLAGDNAPFALGTSAITTVQLCQMGRKDETGRYVALEEIHLLRSNERQAALSL